MQIVVLGYIVRGPLGGMAWHHLQYVIGLKNLSHQVLYLEDSEDYPACYNPLTYQMGTDPGYGLKFCSDLFRQYDLENQWAYFDAHSNNWFGQSKQYVKNFCNNADMVLNLSGINPVRDWWSSIPIKFYIDTDPAFMQIKHLTDRGAMEQAKWHTHFATFGENFGKPDCSIPNDGFDWKPTRQPVCLNLWDASTYKTSKEGNWTTVMQWDSYKTSVYNGMLLGMKSASFDEYFDLPSDVPDSFELALGSHTAPREKLQAAGWIISDPLAITLTSATYKQFIRQSKGEWSVAKQGYIVTNSGWFSERSTAYLASGKPCVLQDTGFSDFLPTGSGLYAFSNPGEAAEYINAINGNYAHHCIQARNLVEEYFRADLTLNKLISDL